MCHGAALHGKRLRRFFPWFFRCFICIQSPDICSVGDGVLPVSFVYSYSAHRIYEMNMIRVFPAKIYLIHNWPNIQWMIPFRSSLVERGKGWSGPSKNWCSNPYFRHALTCTILDAAGLFHNVNGYLSSKRLSLSSTRCPTPIHGSSEAQLG